MLDSAHEYFLIILCLISSAAAAQTLDGEHALSRAFDRVKPSPTASRALPGRGTPDADSERPLIVHCQFGKDRTGFVVAAYRTIVEWVDDAKASEEAFSHGCCFSLFGDLKKLLKDYSRHRQTP